MLTGKLVAITEVRMDWENRTVAVITHEPITHNELDQITFVSTKRIALGDDGATVATPEDAWGVACIEAFADMGGYLKRSPKGTLSFMLPWNDNALALSKPGDRVFYSREAEPIG